MSWWKLVWLVVVGSGLFVCRLGKCEAPRELVAPKATQIPKRLENFGRIRVDNYYWLRDRADPKVIAYLDAENDYTDMVMAHTKSLQKTLFDEIVGRIKQTDTTAPNLEAKNFKLVRAPIESPGREHWQEVVPHRTDVFLERFELFRDFLVLEERRDGLIRLQIRPWSGKGEYQVEFDEPAYLARIGENHELASDSLRFVYTSLTTPQSSFDYDMRKRSKTLVKREDVLGGFDPANYVTERLQATAADGTKVPISIVTRKGFRRDGSHPLLLYGYGSYGVSMDASFPVRADQPARPRFRLRHRPHPGRSGARSRLV
jgi:protease II